jgi:hypothetical protein
LATNDSGSQPPLQAQLTPPGGHPTPLEAEMRAKAATGELVDGGAGPFDLPAMQLWGEERTVRAAVLWDLLAGGQWPVHVKGVRLRGVRISGLLDLEGATLRCPLSLDSCYFDADDPACLDHATAVWVALIRCQLAGLEANMLTARQVDLSYSTLRTGPLSLMLANITDELICSGTQLNGTDSEGNALVAGGLKVGGSVYLDNRFTAAGAVWLARADIAGDLACDGAQLGSNRDGIGLLAEGVKVGGEVFLREGFTADGAVRLLGAAIAGDLSLSGARLGRDLGGNALVADRMKVGGEVHLHHGFTADGAIALTGADITGDLSLSGAQLTGTDDDGNALVADGIRVGAAVLLDQEFTAAGTVSFNSARAGQLVLSPAKLLGADEITFDFTAAEAQIDGVLRWAPDGQFSGRVNLQDARVGELEDSWTPTGGQAHGYWPLDGRLRLNGLTYAGLGDASLEQRLWWIRSQYQGIAPAAFAAQPYEQLAAIYRQARQDTEARKVEIAQERDRRTYGNLSWFGWFGNWFLDKTIRYGYQTWRAAAGLAVVFVAFLLLSIVGQHLHVLVPTGDIKGLHPVPTATWCTSNYPCFYPLGYTIDTVIPIINVHQASYWGPDGNAPFGWVWAASAWGATLVGWYPSWLPASPGLRTRTDTTRRRRQVRHSCVRSMRGRPVSARKLRHQAEHAVACSPLEMPLTDQALLNVAALTPPDPVPTHSIAALAAPHTTIPDAA